MGDIWPWCFKNHTGVSFCSLPFPSHPPFLPLSHSHPACWLSLWQANIYWSHNHQARDHVLWFNCSSVCNVCMWRALADLLLYLLLYLFIFFNGDNHYHNHTGLQKAGNKRLEFRTIHHQKRKRRFLAARRCECPTIVWGLSQPETVPAIIMVVTIQTMSKMRLRS